MGITLFTNDGMVPVPIEATATTVSANAGRNSLAVNSWMKNDGANDITFTVTNEDGSTASFTLKSGETNEEPFIFKNLTWVTGSGTSAFRVFALMPRVRG